MEELRILVQQMSENFPDMELVAQAVAKAKELGITFCDGVGGGCFCGRVADDTYQRFYDGIPFPMFVDEHPELLSKVI